MNYLYTCLYCEKAFIITDSPEELAEETEKDRVPEFHPPYCPYCGKNEQVKLIREE